MANTQTSGYYFAPPSHWPVVGSTALFFLAVGAILLMNSHGVGWVPSAHGEFGVTNANFVLVLVSLRSIAQRRVVRRMRRSLLDAGCWTFDVHVRGCR